MRVETLELVNFRGFAERSFRFAPGFNVLVGENGSGKTSVLAALALGAASAIHQLGEAPEPSIAGDDVRWRRFETRGAVHIEKAAHSRLTIRDDRGDLVVQLERHPRGTMLTTGIDAMQSVVRVSSGETIPLPLLVHYGTGRLWAPTATDYSEPSEPRSRFAGYEGALDASTGIDELLRWLRTQELIALQEDTVPEGLEAVRAAIVACVEHCTDIRYNVRQGELLLSFDDERQLPFRLLSDGVRNMVAMVADLAWRAVVLNPWAGRHAAAESPGMVLIDELDLHLHPRWQRRVVDDLRETFPKVQFITTTHSPFIVQALKTGELVNLDGRPELPGASVEDIAEEVMGVEQPQRSRRHVELTEAATQYYQLLEEGRSGGDLKEVKAKLDALAERFTDEPATAAILRAERLAAGLE